MRKLSIKKVVLTILTCVLLLTLTNCEFRLKTN